MALFRTVEPAAEPVTLAEAKAHLRVSHASEDELISGLIRAARDEVEKACGLALIDQSWRLALDCWPRHGTALLPRHPIKEVLSVTVYGSDGEASLVDPGTYQLDSLSRPARLHFEATPAPGRVMNGIEIDFTAGFGEAGTDVPDILKRAILVLVAHWYEFRGVYGAGDQPVSYPPGYDRMISGYRARRIR
jgi:uncharacterized phiE125 gp8 family phage protein